MKDILGRELKDGDMCIGMAIGRDSRGMHIGIFQGSSVVYLSYNEEYINKSCTSNTYLIENPTEKELEIKQKIQKLLDKEAEDKKQRAAMKTIPINKLEIGGIYKSNQDRYYVYLGKRKVIFEQPMYNWSEVKEGNCFASVYFDEKESNKSLIRDVININNYRRSHNIDVIKGNKKLVEKVGQLNLTFPMKTSDENWYSNRKLVLTVE